MSLLSSIDGGKLFEPPVKTSMRCTETVEELKARIVAGLLPAQREFVLDTGHKVLGFCAGFGAGKTRALCAKVVYLALLNPGTVAAVFEPTHILLRDVWMRSFDDYLEEYQLSLIHI